MINIECKVCKKINNKKIPYCSIDCIKNDKEFFAICENAYSIDDAARTCGIPPTTFRRIIKELGITIVQKKKEKEIQIKVCPKCGKEHTAKYGIHCSKSCSLKGRIKSEETKKKTSESLKKTLAEKPELLAPLKSSWGKPHTEQSKQRLSESLKKYHDIHTIRKTKEEKTEYNRFHFMKYYMKRKSLIPETADLNLIKLIYKSAPPGYSVDHIIPVSKGGLHHQDNLQYLTKEENSRKSNRLDYTPEGVIRWQDIVQLTEN